MSLLVLLINLLFSFHRRLSVMPYHSLSLVSMIALYLCPITLATKTQGIKIFNSKCKIGPWLLTCLQCKYWQQQMHCVVVPRYEQVATVLCGVFLVNSTLQSLVCLLYLFAVKSNRLSCKVYIVVTQKSAHPRANDNHLHPFGQFSV